MSELKLRPPKEQTSPAQRTEFFPVVAWLQPVFLLVHGQPAGRHPNAWLRSLDGETQAETVLLGLIDLLHAGGAAGYDFAFGGEYHDDQAVRHGNAGAGHIELKPPFVLHG